MPEGHGQHATGDGAARLELDRRTFVGLGALALGSMTPLAVHAQPSTPAPSATAEASPVPAPSVDEADLLALSQGLTGVDELSDDAVPVLAKLISADPEYIAAFDELTAITDITAAGALDEVPDAARRLAGNITAFWYTGMFDDLPAPDREARFAGLVAWQTVPYTTILTVCKSFGYWAEEVPATFE